MDLLQADPSAPPCGAREERADNERQQSVYSSDARVGGLQWGAVVEATVRYDVLTAYGDSLALRLDAEVPSGGSGHDDEGVAEDKTEGSRPRGRCRSGHAVLVLLVGGSKGWFAMKEPICRRQTFSTQRSAYVRGFLPGWLWVDCEVAARRKLGLRQWNTWKARTDSHGLGRLSRADSGLGVFKLVWYYLTNHARPRPPVDTPPSRHGENGLDYLVRGLPFLVG